ncbi:hypothetical protein [Pseudomonas umsongensis]|uniref:hypothetical protein n=1 Tax=Pseudomonas umsongensis TaxID=198618 RepID=UPI003D7F79BD
MAGQWEPVSGVFWRIPPEPPVEGVSVYWFIFSALVVAIVGAVVVWRNTKKVEPAKWSLRDHLGKVGAVVTYTYLVVIVAMIWGRTGTLLTMPLNEVGDFLAGAFGPVAFFWLVLGFLQQGNELRQGTVALQMQGDELRLSTQALKMQAEELRKSVEQQSIMASAALQQIDAQRTQLQMQHDEREKTLMANFDILTTSSGGGSKGMARNSVRIWNEGAHATDLKISFDPEILGAHLLKLGDMRSDSRNNYAFDFNPSMCADEGIVRIAYLDTEGGLRHQSFAYTLDRAASRFDYKKIYEKHR